MGIPETLDYLEQFGLDSSRLPRGLSLALGTGTITPLEMLSAYAILANGGYRVEPYLIDWVEDRDQNIIYQHRPVLACSRCTRSVHTRSVPEIVVEPDSAGSEPTAEFLAELLSGELPQEPAGDPVAELPEDSRRPCTRVDR